MKPKKLHLANSFKLRRYKKILENINQLSDDYAAMSDKELQTKLNGLKAVFPREKGCRKFYQKPMPPFVKRLSASWGSILTMYKS